MRTKQSGDFLEISTEAYQAKNGGVYINWGKTAMLLSLDDAEVIADNIPGIDRDLYTKFYDVL